MVADFTDFSLLSSFLEELKGEAQPQVVEPARRRAVIAPTGDTAVPGATGPVAPTVYVVRA